MLKTNTGKKNTHLADTASLKPKQHKKLAIGLSTDKKLGEEEDDDILGANKATLAKKVVAIRILRMLSPSLGEVSD